MLKVPYLPESAIEADAELLIAEYESTASVAVGRDVPVEEIATYHLGLRLEFGDLHEILGVPRGPGEPSDILGAIWFEKATIGIDSSLDPTQFPRTRGRYRFSVAHEIGHWRLHRPYAAANPDQTLLFDLPASPTICRSSEAKAPIEWQADRYASCLLMPRRQVRQEWELCLGRKGPLQLSDLQPGYKESQPAGHTPEAGEAKAGIDILFEKVAEPLAERFGVSRPAMRIRLEQLGLMLRQAPRQSLLGVT